MTFNWQQKGWPKATVNTAALRDELDAFKVALRDAKKFLGKPQEPEAVGAVVAMNGGPQTRYQLNIALADGAIEPLNEPLNAKLLRIVGTHPGTNLQYLTSAVAMSRATVKRRRDACRCREDRTPRQQEDRRLLCQGCEMSKGIVKTGRATVAVVDSAFYDKVRDVFEQARQFVRTTANFAMVKAYWLVGKMIVEKQGGAAKATYGDGLIDELSRRLTKEFGAGFKRVNLFNMRRFFLSFPKVHTLCEQLSWSHYRLLISVENEKARQYYLEEARKSLWSVRELQRQINSFYYERLLENRAKGRRPRPLYAADAQQANLRRQVQVALAKRTGVDSRTPPRTHGNQRRTARRLEGLCRSPVRQEVGILARLNGIIHAMGISDKKQNAAVGEIVVKNLDRNDDVRQVVSFYGLRRVVVKCIMPTRK